MPNQSSIVLAANSELLQDSGIDNLLAQIRPHWKAQNLTARVKRLLPVDPSSACQRIFNACIHDLKQKLAIAGIDITAEAAVANKLPPIARSEDLERYTPYNTIELAYRVGILSRAESRRLFRVYDIRSDLEHEDNEYEATVEDCIYVFKTAVECVLARDPIQIIKLKNVKEIIEQPSPITLDLSVLDDYEHAPDIRQSEIHKFLISTALNSKQPDIVRQNAWIALRTLKPITRNSVLISSAEMLSEKIGRNSADLLQTRVAFAGGILPYLKKNQVAGFFKTFLEQMKKTGYSFRSHAQHRELLRNFDEVGGLAHCPSDILSSFIEWLVLCYVGEPGGYGQGWGRKVFYSNVGAPMALDLINVQKDNLHEAFKTMQKESKLLRGAVLDQHVERRFENIKDLFS